MNTYDSNNVFAKILRGEIPAARVYEDEATLAFMDVMPQAEGHTLVISKSPARNLFDISPDDLGTLIRATQHVAKGVRQAFSPAGVRIAQFNEPAAGQTVFHIHFHIIPCYEGVPMRPHGREMADKQTLEAHAAKIRAALGR
ncbi:MAG TPA: HIT family protein [Steroidobacteraceae bacterium]|nr:HIT family protein [Steroidobacteraceae bacterium]